MDAHGSVDRHALTACYAQPGSRRLHSTAASPHLRKPVRSGVVDQPRTRTRQRPSAATAASECTMNDFAEPAVAIHPNARDIQYREVRSFRALSARMHRGYSRMGWAMAGVFALTTVIAFAGWSMFPTTVFMP